MESDQATRQIKNWSEVEEHPIQGMGLGYRLGETLAESVALERSIDGAEKKNASPWSEAFSRSTCRCDNEDWSAA